MWGNCSIQVDKTRRGYPRAKHIPRNIVAKICSAFHKCKSQGNTLTLQISTLPCSISITSSVWLNSGEKQLRAKPNNT